MSRFVVTFCLLSLPFCSVGCRMCSTPYDCTIPAHINRYDDYRGSHPAYRAGSIFDGWGGTHQVVRGTLHEAEFIDYYSNAGNYGITTPVTTLRHIPDYGPGTFGTQPGIERIPIGIPRESPEDGFYYEPRVRDPNGKVPTVEELLNPQRDAIPPPLPMPIPVTPPGRPRNTPSSEDTPIDTIPFSPNDAVPNNTVPNNGITIPPSPFPPIMDTDPPITLEELRRLDPTIQDMQIISVEDVTPGARVR